MMKVINRIYDYISKITYVLYLYALGILLPLYFRDYYFDMMEAKAYMYKTIIEILSIPLIVVLILKIICKRFTNKRRELKLILIVFLITSLASTLLSRDINNSIYGSKGWHIGLFVIASSIISILILSDIKINRIYYLPIIFCTGFVYLVSILHAFEIDIFSLHHNILEVSMHKYTTTIGNINWYTGYLALTVPVFVGLYLKAKDKTKIIMFFVVSSLGLLSVSLLGSDGIFLGFGVLSFFIVPYIFKDIERVKRFGILVLVFGVGLLVARYLDYCMDGYAALLRRRIVIVPVLVIGIIMILMNNYLKEETYNKLKKKIIIIIEILLVLISIIFVVMVINTKDAEWGTGRIALWNDSLKLFNNFNTKEKLLGIGYENLYRIYGPINERYKGVYLSSHSEWVQLLLTGGIINTFIYLVFWLYIFIQYIKNKNDIDKSISLGLICYFGQSYVNSATVCNVGILSILILLLINNTID